LNLKRVTPIAAIVLLCVFCIFVIFYERHERRIALSDIETHARVIANALWNLNPQGASEYLSLACESQNYENIVVTDTNGKIFQEAVRNAPNWQEKLFVTLHLISSVQLTSNVAYEGKTIGEIKAIWNCSSIYLELFVLFALVLIFFIIQLNARLFHAKQILEDKVFKRTSELSCLNNDLLLEAEEHRQAREALFKSEERYRLMADNIADVLWVTDMNLKCTYISPSIYQLVGYTSK
jgi:PAS domain-containing protein